ncbi:hypothetical protein Pmar_PMAR015327 [Perkinsus marinus ATCC 50983]|uniref:Uncharacterized protein n=1 Tax=Perkinsus marinus (strain ATCC 50983 / TXsc) TaxID=423536 RepID=C5KLA9_PERM5|nr:hypothetical protein Pmar_PMAR015327 [Perkinsus marinus ATCC 50983]EER14782.1 hypothetical protein Pmar_PMAR015327 [Perkinsus marinus ATCC 50983]|eukprot:XP_002782986.1 hypothetical protein Pmar_PMAR015327 [Perkinsus marinus ATCC 50983]
MSMSSSEDVRARVEDVSAELCKVERSLSKGEEYLFLKGKLLEEYRDLVQDKLIILKAWEDRNWSVCRDAPVITRSLVEGPATSGDIEGPTASGEVERPTTSGEVEGPTTSGEVEGPTTSGEVEGPTTSGEVEGPTTDSEVGKATTPGGADAVIAEESVNDELIKDDVVTDGLPVTTPVSEPDEAASAEVEGKDGVIPGAISLTVETVEGSAAQSLRAHLESLKCPGDIRTIRKALVALVPLVRQQGAVFTSMGGIQVLKALTEEDLAIDLVGRVFCSLCDDDRVSPAVVASIVDLGLLKAVLLALVREGVARLLSVDPRRLTLEIINIISDMDSHQEMLEVPLSLIVDCVREEVITEDIVMESISSSFGINRRRPHACVNLCFAVRRLGESGLTFNGIDSQDLVVSIVKSLQHAQSAPRILAEGTLALEVLGKIDTDLLEMVQGVCRSALSDPGVQKAGLWSIARMSPKLCHHGSVDLRLARVTVDLCIKAMGRYSHDRDVVLVAMGCLLEEMRCFGDDEEAWEAIVQYGFRAGIVILLEEIIVEHGPENPRLAIMAGEIIRTVRRRIPCDKSPLPFTSSPPMGRPFGDVPSEEVPTIEQGEPLPIGRGILKPHSMDASPLEGRLF